MIEHLENTYGCHAKDSESLSQRDENHLTPKRAICAKERLAVSGTFSS